MDADTALISTAITNVIRVTRALGNSGALSSREIYGVTLFQVSLLACSLVWDENTIRDPTEYGIFTSFLPSLLSFSIIEILLFSLKAFLFSCKTF